MTVAPGIDPARFLQEHLAQASPDLLRDRLSTFVNTLLSADADAVCGASYRSVSDERTNQRNGFRHRDFAPPPGLAPSTSRSRSCARAATSPTGSWSAASEPNAP